MDTLHEEVSMRWPDKPWKVNGKHNQEVYEPYLRQVRSEFYAKGCNALQEFMGGPTDWCKPPENQDTKDRLAAIGELYGLLGDDVDGAASMIEDFGL